MECPDRKKENQANEEMAARLEKEEACPGCGSAYTGRFNICMDPLCKFGPKQEGSEVICPKCGLHHEREDLANSDQAETNRKMADEAIQDRDLKLFIVGQAEDLADVQRVLYLLVDHFKGDLRSSRRIDQSDKDFITSWYDDFRAEGW